MALSEKTGFDPKPMTPEIKYECQIIAALTFRPEVQKILLQLAKPAKFIEVYLPKITAKNTEVYTLITFALQRAYTYTDIVGVFELWDKLLQIIANELHEEYITLCDMEIFPHQGKNEANENTSVYEIRLTLPLDMVTEINVLALDE